MRNISYYSNETMLILLKTNASRNEIDTVKNRIIELGFTPHEIPGVQRVAIGVTGNNAKVSPDNFLLLPGVVDVISVSKPFSYPAFLRCARQPGRLG